MLNGKEKLVERLSARQFPSFQCENTAAAGFVARKFMPHAKTLETLRKHWRSSLRLQRLGVKLCLL
jgi:hypothetical protein